jgi:hypothetical protein
MAANRYAIANGNYSNPAIWNGGLGVPAADDTVRPNGFTVVIDQSITAAILTNNASSPAVAGGGFQVTATSGTINIVANIEGRYIGHVVRVMGVGVTVNFIGNLNQFTILLNSTVSYCINIEVTCTFTHTGTGSGGVNNVNYGPTTGSIRVSAGTPTLTLTGVYTGGTAQALSPNPAIMLEGGFPNLIINGSLVGGGATLCPAVYFAQTGAAAYMIVNGTITASIAPAIVVIWGSATTPMIVSGQINNVNGVNAIYAHAVKLLNNASTVWTYQTNDSLSNEVLYTADELTGYPPTNKTEQGYVYGPNDEFTGILVPFETDTAQLAEDLLAAIVASSDPLSTRLKNCATTASVNAAIASIPVAP